MRADWERPKRLVTIKQNKELMKRGRQLVGSNFEVQTGIPLEVDIDAHMDVSVEQIGQQPAQQPEAPMMPTSMDNFTTSSQAGPSSGGIEAPINASEY